ncbi:MAG: DNA polymerase I [Candidatus Margulisiibacteriota bacterium]
MSILVIDGHSLAYRAFFAFPPNLTLPDGQPINAVFGFFTLLLKAYDELNPSHFIICFDRKEPTFRHDLYTAYKAHRPPAPEEFRSQMTLLKQALGEVGIPILESPGFEADDIMGTLSALSHTWKTPCFLMTGDTDCLQLVDTQTSVVLSKARSDELHIMDSAAVQDRYGLSPAQLIDFKALKGDPSDNIPGVAGIGEKTATNLLQTYATLEGIYENLDAITGATHTKLQTGREMAFLSQTLVRIVTDVPINPDLSAYAYSPNWAALFGIFERFKFNLLMRKYAKFRPGTSESVAGAAEIPSALSAPEATPTAPSGTYALVDATTLDALLPKLQAGFALDLETDSATAVSATILGLSFSVSPGEAYYVPLPAPKPQLALFSSPEPTPTLPEALLKLKPILENPTIPKITHNGKFELTVLRHAGIHLRGIGFDTMIAAFLLFPLETVGLKDLAARHLNVAMTAFETLTQKGKIPFADIPLEQAAAYAGADADMTLQLKLKFDPLLKAKGLESLFSTIEMPLQAVLADMETTGVCLDTAYLNQLESTFDGELNTLSKSIFEAAGMPFNINSPKQLGSVLFDTLQLPVIKTTKTGRSTDVSVLEALKTQHPIVPHLLRFRTLEKLQSTYVRALPSLINPETGRVHASFNQTIAVTGRLSSSNPNLQNIPIRTEEGRKLRRAFIPSAKNRLILSADYSQIELRILAHLAQDKAMIAAFKAGEDIHTSTAAEVFGVPKSEVTKDQRYKAKAVNFGIIYGQSSYGLSDTLGISMKEAKAIIDHYFEIFPTIKTFMNTTIAFAQDNGFVRTEFGRIRPIPDISSGNRSLRQFAERTAVNTRVQGTAADIIKIAMNRIFTQLETEKLASKLMIQVHDELVFDVVDSELETVQALVKTHMEGAASFSVPLSVDSVVGPSWEELEG